jgi:hypothetical protein
LRAIEAMCVSLGVNAHGYHQSQTFMLHEGMSFSAEIEYGLYLKVLLETFSTNDVMKDCLL